MNNVMKKIVSIVSMICLVLPIMLINNSLGAAVGYFDLRQTSSIAWKSASGLQSIPSVGNNIGLPYGDTVKLDMNLVNMSGDVSALLSLYGKEGISFHAYYAGVLKINGSDASAEQYASFTNGSGMSVLLSATNTTVSLEAQSIGTGKNRLAADLRVYSNEVTQGQSTLYYEYAFTGFFSLPTKYVVNFFNYDGGLLDSQVLFNSQIVTIPNIKREGFVFLGFNTKIDGTGTYLTDTIVSSSLDLYAVFKKSMFQINYYVDDSLFETKQVEYNGAFPEVKAPSKEGYKFIEWKGRKNGIRENLDIYAVYEAEDGTRSLKIARKKVVEGSNLIEKIAEMLKPIEKTAKQKEIYEIKETPNKDDMLKDQIFSWIWIPILFMGGILLYTYRKYKSK